MVASQCSTRDSNVGLPESRAEQRGNHRNQMGTRWDEEKSSIFTGHSGHTCNILHDLNEPKHNSGLDGMMMGVPMTAFFSSGGVSAGMMDKNADTSNPNASSGLRRGV